MFYASSFRVALGGSSPPYVLTSVAAGALASLATAKRKAARKLRRKARRARKRAARRAAAEAERVARDTRVRALASEAPMCFSCVQNSHLTGLCPPRLALD